MADYPFVWKFLEKRTGIVCSSFRRKRLSHIVHQRIQMNKCNSEEDYLNLLQTGRGVSELYLLIDEVVVGETSFVRMPQFWENLKCNILPRLVEGAIRHGKSLKFWSAGCSTGEETYTLAMNVKEKYPVLPVKISILGSDISRSALLKARKGIYGRNSFRREEAERFLHHFSIEDDKYAINDEIKELVTFEQINLMDNFTTRLELQECDLILCRNVLIYYNDKRIETIAHKFYSVLNNGGYLSLGGIAASLVAKKLPVPVRIDGFSWYTKGDNQKAITLKTVPKENVNPEPEREKHQLKIIEKDEVKTKGQQNTAYQRALELYYRENYADAIKVLRNEHEASYEILLLKGLIELNTNTIEDARNTLQSLQKERSSQPEGLMLEAMLLETEELWEDAIEKSRAAAFTDGSFFSAFFHLAKLHRYINNMREASLYYRIAGEALDRDTEMRVKLFCGNVSIELLKDICVRNGAE